jgi:hypothetical protein
MYIDADAFEADCRKRYCTGCENYNGIKCKSCWVADMLDEIENAPALSPDEVRGVGEWIEDRMDYRCSACGETVKDEIFYMFYPYRLPKFCPNCGARMKGASEDA